MIVFYFLLFGRIILLGFEKVFVKLLSKYNGGTINFWWFSIAFLVYLPFAIYYGIPDLSFIAYSIMASFFYFIAFYFYTKSLQIEDISLVSPLYNFNVIFLLILADRF